MGAGSRGSGVPSERGPGVHRNRNGSQRGCLCSLSGAGSPHSAQDVLALNAAAIIANIKLQTRLKNAEDGRPPKDASAASSSASSSSSPRQGHEGRDNSSVLLREQLFCFSFC